MTERQRELSRTVVPLIQTTMTPGYERGFAEKGSGSHARRVAVVEQHLQSNKGSMYVCLSSLLILPWHSCRMLVLASCSGSFVCVRKENGHKGYD
jgi:hypothetical protein